MFGVVEQWVNTRSGDSLRLLTKENVRNGKNHKAQKFPEGGIPNPFGGPGAVLGGGRREITADEQPMSAGFPGSQPLQSNYQSQQGPPQGLHGQPSGYGNEPSFGGYGGQQSYNAPGGYGGGPGGPYGGFEQQGPPPSGYGYSGAPGGPGGPPLDSGYGRRDDDNRPNEYSQGGYGGPPSSGYPDQQGGYGGYGGQGYGGYPGNSRY